MFFFSSLLFLKHTHIDTPKFIHHVSFFFSQGALNSPVSSKLLLDALCSSSSTVWYLACQLFCKTFLFFFFKNGVVLSFFCIFFYPQVSMNTKRSGCFHPFNKCVCNAALEMKRECVLYRSKHFSPIDFCLLV